MNLFKQYIILNLFQFISLKLFQFLSLFKLKTFGSYFTINTKTIWLKKYINVNIWFQIYFNTTRNCLNSCTVFGSNFEQSHFPALVQENKFLLNLNIRIPLTWDQLIYSLISHLYISNFAISWMLQWFINVIPKILYFQWKIK